MRSTATWRRVVVTGVGGADSSEQLGRGLERTAGHPLSRSELGHHGVEPVRGLPNDPAVLSFVTAVLVETHDEWAVAEWRYLSEESMAKLYSHSRDDAVEEEPLAITA